MYIVTAKSLLLLMM